MLKPKHFNGTIPGEVRYVSNSRAYWLAYFGQGIWSVDCEDDSASLIRCCGDWRDAIVTYEKGGGW